MKPFEIRPYQTGDEQAICDLKSSVFPNPTTLDYWTWQYRDNPFINDVFAYVAISPDGDIVGHFGGLPRIMQIFDREKLSLVASDAVIHPDFQRQGVFTALNNHVLSAVPARGFGLLYAYANQRSSKTFLTPPVLTLQPTVSIYLRPLRFSPLVQHVLKNHVISSIGGKTLDIGFRLRYRSKEPDPSYNYQEIKRFDERFDELWAAIKSIAPIMTRRDATYLNWRYVESPRTYRIFTIEKNEHLMGYAILNSRDLFGIQTAMVIDLVTRQGDLPSASALIQYITQVAWQTNHAMLSALLFEHMPYRKLFTQAGFLYVPQHFRPQKMALGTFNAESGYSNAQIGTPENWFLMWGDHDAF